MEAGKGLYAANIVERRSKKPLRYINSENIKYDLETNTFEFTIEKTDEIMEKLVFVEFYLKTDASSINYGQRNKSKMIGKGYEINLKIPLNPFKEFEVTS